MFKPWAPWFGRLDNHSLQFSTFNKLPLPFRTMRLLSTNVNIVYISEPDQLEGYIHAVSPMKTANISKKKYFNIIIHYRRKMTLWEEFVSLLKNMLSWKLWKKQSPVKLQNYKVSPTNDIIIDQKSCLSPMDHIPFVMSVWWSAMAWHLSMLKYWWHHLQ